MAEDKVLQSKEELGLKSESSSGMSESSVPEIQEKLDLVDELSSVSLDIEKCQVVFKKESDVAGHKSTVTKEAKVEAADGKQDYLDQSSSDEEKGEDLSAGKVKESEIGTSTGADKSDATSSDNGVDFNASLSVAATSEGKDSANQEKVNLEDELLSVSQQASSTAAVGSLDFADKGLSDESEATPVEKKVDMKDAPLVDQEKSQVLSSGKSKDLEIGSSTDDKVKAIQEKLDLDDKLSSDHFTSKKESVDDDDDGSKPKVGKEDNMAADENLAAADNSSLVITETQVEAAEGDEVFPFNNSSVTKEAQVEAAEGNQDLPGATKSEPTSSDNGVGFKASLSVAATSEGKDSVNQEKVNLEDELLSGQFGFKKESDDVDAKSTDKSKATPAEKKVDMKDAPLVDQEKSQVLFSGKSKDLEIESSTGTSDDKVKAIQENLALDDKHSSDHFTSKKELDSDGSKPKVGKEDNMEADENLAAVDNGSPVIIETQAEAAEENEDFPFNNSSEAQVEAAEGNQDLPDNSSFEADKSEVTSSDNGVDLNASFSIAATSEGKDSANQEKVNLEDELLSGLSGFKKESDDDDGKSTVTKEAQVEAAEGNQDLTDNSSLAADKSEASSSDNGVGCSASLFIADKSKATSDEKKVDMKDAPLVDQEKSQVPSSGKSKDLEIGKSKVGKEDNMEADKNLAAADNGSPVITATQVEAAEGNEDFPFNNSSGQIALKKESDGNDNKLIVTKEAQVEEAEGNQDLTDNSSLAADKSEASSSDNGVDFYASLSVAGSSEEKVKAIQEKLDLDDKLSSDHFTSKKESDDDGSKSKVIKETQVEAAEGNEDFPFNNSSENKTSDDKDVDLDDDPLVVRAKDCFQQGNKEYRQGDFHRALQLYTEGLQLNCKDNRLTARLYNNRAAAHFRLENFENSLDDATVAVQLEPTFIKALEKGAEACVQLKLYDEAKIWCHKGLAMDDNSKRLRHLLNKCGSETIASGEIKPQQEKFKTAIDYYKQHLEIAKEVGDKAGEGRSYGNLGNAYLRLRQFKTAIDYYKQHLEIAKEFKTAIDYHKQHLEIAKEVGDTAVEGRSYGNLGNAYCRLGQFKIAIDYHKQDLEIAKEVGDRAGEGGSYGNLGSVYLRLRQFKTAIDYHKQNLEIAKEVGDKAGEGVSYGNLGNAHHCLGQFKTAIEYHRRHLEIVKEVGDKHGIAQALCSLATNFESHECLQTALDYYISSREIFNNVRASLHHHWKISYRNVHKTAYKGVWRVLLLKGEHVKALLAAEEGRAQDLRDLVDLKYSFRQTFTWSNSRKCSDCLSLRNVSSDVVFLAITGPYIALWTIRNGEVVQSRIKHVNNFLYQRELEVYITSLNKAASLQVSARAAVEWEKSSTQVGRDEKGTSDGSPRNATTNALRKLYDIIVAPIADLIDGDELVFVPEGPLCLVPYAALVDSNSRYLCESFRIRVIPSLTILKSISDCPTELHNKTGALLVGDPCYKQVLYQGDLLNQLPGARKEVKMIGGILGIAPLVGGEATKEEVFRRISSVALVHIAAHGKKETGEILLAPNTSRTTCQAEEEDYLLTMRDVLRAGLRAKLVVLSCCHSACGEVMAEGVVGIARAFLGAGARSVLVSLWAIDDDGTQEFMKHFYGALEEGKGTSEAVNQAMKCMRESETFSKGYYWAPFVLIGDDVKLELTEIKRSSLMDLFEDKRRPQAFGTD
ncbi:uncharacterized protein [Pocillopora verrucosa]|uniref:uncharacterized protein n=1 Tax=Pocillopora verrucosa TaxID=203993 RepID=UPI0033419226